MELDDQLGKNDPWTNEAFFKASGFRGCPNMREHLMPERANNTFCLQTFHMLRTAASKGWHTLRANPGTESLRGPASGLKCGLRDES